MSEEKYAGITIQNSIGAGAKELFKIRNTYDEVFPKIVGSYDFNSPETLQYGRVDLDGDVVHVNEFYLREISTTKAENVFCLNFVADAFEDFRNSVKSQYVNKLKEDDFLTTDWDATSGWQSPHSFYDNRMSDINQVLIRGNLFLKNNKDSVKNIDDFFKIFFNDFYPSMNGDMPLTKSGIISSKYYNPSSTGLCVQIFNDSIGLDSVKFNKFIKSPNFDFYLLSAAEHGFIVDKNAPWRLIANLNSPRMQEYMALNNLDISNLFDTCFVKTYKYDVQNLKVYMKQMYDAFLTVSPNYLEQKPVFSNEKCTTYQQQDKILKQREPINTVDYNNKYGNLFWLKIYYRIKLNENHITRSNFVLSKQIKQIVKLYNLLDFNKALDYINNNTKP